MVMQDASMDWTVEKVHALPEDSNRYEVIDGELFVTPAPSWSHQEAVAVLFQFLRPYANQVGLHAVFAPAAVTFSSRREVQPDLFAVPLVGGRRPSRFEDVGALTLAVEVLSPGTTRVDRHRKRRLYQSECVSEYWIVDAPSQVVERWRPGDDEPEILLTTLSWQPRADREPLVIDLGDYFRQVSGAGGTASPGA